VERLGYSFGRCGRRVAQGPVVWRPVEEPLWYLEKHLPHGAALAWRDFVELNVCPAPNHAVDLDLAQLRSSWNQLRFTSMPGFQEGASGNWSRIRFRSASSTGRIHSLGLTASCFEPVRHLPDRRP